MVLQRSLEIGSRQLKWLQEVLETDQILYAISSPRVYIQQRLLRVILISDLEGAESNQSAWKMLEGMFSNLMSDLQAVPWAPGSQVYGLSPMVGWALVNQLSELFLYSTGVTNLSPTFL